MMLEPLPPRGGLHVLRVSGEVDALTAGPLHDKAIAMISSGPLVLDLTEVSFFDSSGVRAVNRLARAHAAGTGLRVVAPAGGRVRRVLDIVGFGGDLVVDDLDQALTQLRA